jgi:diguanylate cyclase (GGDEF)-like protein
MAHFDMLTTLPNRVLLADRLHQAMAQAQRRSRLLAVAFLDLDGFKAINDEHGHDAGDRLLVALATRMRQALREVDTLARIGGDEFVAVLADLDDIEASPPLLSRLLESVSQPVNLDDRSFQVTASLGVTFHPQPDPVDADQLLRQADQAMYQAKLAGKNRFHVFDPEQDRGVRGRHENLEQVRAALLGGEFVLHFQPKVNMCSGSVVGAEALLRWQHPVRGLLPPGDFLPVVEDHVLAVEVGDWVIGSALDQQERWREAGLALPVSVNVSARHLQEPDFVARLRRHLAAHPRLRPGDLTLEVLETTALEDLDQSARIVESCRRMQVSFALDDFGTGYSSLTYLKRLGMAQLKIDQSFVRDMLEDPDDLAILEGVLGLAAAFRREVVAEGVERIEQGVLLLQLGCEVAQGYAIARPMPGAELPDWVARWRPDPAWLGRPTVSRDDLPLLVAGVEHRAWIKALLGHLGGERLQPPPLDLLECRFGHWLAGHARQRFAARPELRRIEDLHVKVHGLAALMCGLHDDGHREQALARADDLLSISAALEDQLKRLASASRA